VSSFASNSRELPHDISITYDEVRRFFEPRIQEVAGSATVDGESRNLLRPCWHLGGGRSDPSAPWSVMWTSSEACILTGVYRPCDLRVLTLVQASADEVTGSRKDIRLCPETVAKIAQRYACAVVDVACSRSSAAQNAQSLVRAEPLALSRWSQLFEGAIH
jgi:hypothetical protein